MEGQGGGDSRTASERSAASASGSPRGAPVGSSRGARTSLAPVLRVMSAVILGALQTADAGGAFGVLDERVLSTAVHLEEDFRRRYPIIRRDGSARGAQDTQKDWARHTLRITVVRRHRA